MSSVRRPQKRQRDVDKIVSAAYLRMLGSTQAQAAKAVGRSPRTLRRWESASSWAAAREEARRRWLAGLTDAARRTLLDSVRQGEDGRLALAVLERLEPELAPAVQRIAGRLELVERLARLPTCQLQELEKADDETVIQFFADKNGAAGG